MKRLLLLALVLLASSGLVGPAHAEPQATDDLIVLAEWLPWNWRMPASDRYETYDPQSGRSYAVDEASVVDRIRRGEWIFDRSSGAWVSGPGEAPIAKKDCKKGGWERLGYRNQGQCVSAAARAR